MILLKAELKSLICSVVARTCLLCHRIRGVCISSRDRPIYRFTDIFPDI